MMVTAAVTGRSDESDWEPEIIADEHTEGLDDGGDPCKKNLLKLSIISLLCYRVNGQHF